MIRRSPMKADSLTLSVILTPAQLKMLRLKADGSSTREIGESCKTSADSVQTQLDSARRNTGCSNTAQLVALLVKAGML